MGSDGAALTRPVLVTGAGGFVGSAVVRALVAGRVGHVVALVRPAGTLERLEELTPSPDWQVARGDITDHAVFAALLKELRPCAVVHVALDPRAERDPTEESWREFVDQPLETIFAALREVPGARLVTTGSASVLPPGDSLHEELEPSPSATYPEYAKLKLYEERRIAEIGARAGVPWMHLRLFYMFGKYESQRRLLPHIVRHLLANEPAELSSGAQVRDFTDVDDVAGAYVRALEASEDRCGRVYHVGSGRGISVRAFAMEVAGVLGREELLRFGSAAHADTEARAVIADVSRAARELDWAASSDTRERIRRVTRWWIGRSG